MNTSTVVFSTLSLMLVGLVATQLVVVIISSITSIRWRRKQYARNCQLLEERIQTAKANRVQTDKVRSAWNGYRKFVIDRKVEEAKGVCSFYLVPHDRKPLPEYKPGQFLTFQLNIPEQDKPVVRCYSLSDSPRSDYCRVTIKRVPPPHNQPSVAPGLASNYFNDICCEGDILDVRAPGGNFVLDQSKTRPVVLMAGGVGITPLLSMINWIAESGSKREAWLFYGVRNRDEHAMRDHLSELAQKYDNLHVITCYSEPGDNDVEGRDYDHRGYVSVKLLAKYFDSNNYEYYVCGPPAMMSAITKQLARWGVPKGDVFTEAFGPASVKAKKQAAPKPPTAPTVATCTVRFERCGKEVTWDDIADNLLEFGEANGVNLVGGCRAGSCGTCEIAVVSGEIEYNQEPEYSDLKDGCCLTCIGTPKGDVVLDA